MEVVSGAATKAATEETRVATWKQDRLVRAEPMVAGGVSATAACQARLAP
jgi:hypothetical protein